jgi:hypothetical protein
MIMRVPFRTSHEAHVVARFRNRRFIVRHWWSWFTDPLTACPMNPDAMVEIEMRRQDELNRSMASVISAIVISMLAIGWLL